MFFNFSVGEIEEETSSSSRLGQEEPEKHEKNIKKCVQSNLDLGDHDDFHLGAKEVTMKDWHRHLLSKLQAPPSSYSIPGSGMKLRFVNSAHIPGLLAASDSTNNTSEMQLRHLVGLSDSHHSDLISGVYEGGLKCGSVHLTWSIAYQKCL